MCNALSPEKSVIWSVLHGLVPDGLPDDLNAEHFTHPAYRVWFDAVCELRQADAEISVSALEAVLQGRGHEMRDLDARALKRMLRISPPARIADNAVLLCQALIDRHMGRSVHLERLIN